MLIDEQMKLLKTSRLAEVATINVVMTIPMYFTFIYEHGQKFVVILREYIKKRYPFVNILEIRDTGEKSLYEGQTLRFLHEYSFKGDFDICYFHSKGMTSSSPAVICWREILNHFVVQEWPTCVKMLKDYDMVGVKDACVSAGMTSGNFWWAKSEYIRTLPEPLDSSKYEKSPEFFPNGYDYRYAFEYWPTVGNPKLSYIADTKTDHFSNICYLENLLNK